MAVIVAKTYQGVISGIGDVNNNINIITGQTDASLLNMCIGYESGIAGNVFDEFKISYSQDGEYYGDKVEMGSGIAFAYGFKGVMDTTTSFDIIKYSTGNTNEYYYIIAEFDTTVIPNKFTLKLIYNSFTETISFRQDNLLKSAIGIYQLPLYKLQVTLDSDGDKVSYVTPMCDKYTNVKESNKARYADTPTENDSSEKIVTTELLHKMVDINEDITIADDKTVKARFCRIGTKTVIANFDQYLSVSSLTAEKLITANTTIGRITNTALIPKTTKEFILQIVSQDGLLTGCKIQIFENNGLIISQGKLYGASINTTPIVALSGTIVYSLD